LQLPTPGFKLNFHFSPNEYFEDAVLSKSYLYQDEIGYRGDFVYERAIGTTIKWKEDKDLTKQVEIKRQRNKNTNRTRVIRRTLPTDSFFNFFSPPNVPDRKAIEEGDIDEDELEELEERIELDYQIGEDLKERIIPRAIDYFTGKALEYDGVELDSDDDDNYEDEDDEDFEDTDDDEIMPIPQKKPTKENVDPKECKQQ
jgi:nucleosome assembly protein 1-like 1